MEYEAREFQLSRYTRLYFSNSIYWHSATTSLSVCDTVNVLINRLRHEAYNNYKNHNNNNTTNLRFRESFYCFTIYHISMFIKNRSVLVRQMMKILDFHHTNTSILTADFKFKPWKCSWQKSFRKANIVLKLILKFLKVTSQSRKANLL